MKILIITPAYHPKQQPRAYRWTALAEYWAKKGIEVHVLCTLRKGWNKESRWNDVTLHRTGYANLKDALYDWLQITHRRDEVQQKTPPKSRWRKWLGMILYRLNLLFWHGLYWPDGSWIWYFSAKKSAFQLLAQTAFDTIITVSHPFTAHLVGQAIHQKYPDLNWIVDIGDPFAFLDKDPLNNHFLYKKRNFRAEQKVLKLASKITVTVAATREMYLNQFELRPGKITVIPPLHLPTKPQQDLLPVFSKSHLHLAYFGSFYDGIRQPLHFLQLVAASLQTYPMLSTQLRLHFFGTIPAFTQNDFDQFPHLQSLLVFHGLISQAEAQQRMEACDILVNISNQTTYQLPSKVADYLFSGKPIVNICYQEEDNFALFLKDYPNLLNAQVTSIFPSPDLVKQFISFLLYPPVPIPTAILEQLGAPYQIEAIAAQYLNRGQPLG